MGRETGLGDEDLDEKEMRLGLGLDSPWGETQGSRARDWSWGFGRDGGDG